MTTTFHNAAGRIAQSSRNGAATLALDGRVRPGCGNGGLR